MKENVNNNKNFSTEIKYKDKVYKLVFNLNSMEEIQEEYGTIQEWGNLTEGGKTKEPNIKALVFGLKAMINEGIDISNDENGTNEPFLTDKQVGRILTEVGLNEAMSKVQKTVIESTKSDSKN